MSDESRSPDVMWVFLSDEETQTMGGPLAAELPASASGEGGATSARGHEASVQTFTAEAENEKSKLVRGSTLAWLSEKGDAKQNEEMKKHKEKSRQKEKGCVEEKDKSKKATALRRQKGEEQAQARG